MTSAMAEADSGLGLIRDWDDELDEAIAMTEEALRGWDLGEPPELQEYFQMDIWLGPTYLSYTCGAGELRTLLAKLWALRERGDLTGSSEDTLARIVVDLDPIAAQFVAEAGAWRGGMMAQAAPRIARMTDEPVVVVVRGGDRQAAERKIAWLLSQQSRPQGDGDSLDFANAA